METQKLKCGELKLNLGCGRKRMTGYIGIDRVGYIDGNGNQAVDIIRDLEKEGLPFCDNSCVEIVADAFLEHIVNLEFLLNECWRVLKPGGILKGAVPNAGSDGSFRDPTHKRFFTESTFSYFCGENLANPNFPKHPKYARYDFLAWNKIKVERPNNNGCINFEMSPRKEIIE